MDLQAYTDSLLQQGLSENTVLNYVCAVTDYIFFIENKINEPFNSRNIIELDINEYKNYLLNEKKQKPTTINNKLSGLSKYCAYLLNCNVISYNPVARVKQIKIQSTNTSPKSLSKSDIYKLRREFYKTGNTRDIAIFELLYTTGIRVSELCNIEPSDITISDRKGSLVIRSGKGSKYRTVPLNTRARKALFECFGTMALLENKKLFRGQRGALNREGIYRIIRKYADSAKLEHVSPHTLRHSFCKELLSNGIDIVTVANIAGHSDINTTAIYTKPTEDEKYLAVEYL